MRPSINIDSMLFSPITDVFSASLELSIFSTDSKKRRDTVPESLVHKIFFTFSYANPISEDQVPEFERILKDSLKNFYVLGILCEEEIPIHYEKETGQFIGVYKRDNRNIINTHEIPDQTITMENPLDNIENIDKFLEYTHRASPFERNRAPSSKSIRRSSSINRFGSE